MINSLKIIFLLLFAISFDSSFSQNMATLTGRSRAFMENDKVLLRSNAGYSDSSFIHNNKFKFDIPFSKGALYSLIFPNESKTLKYPLFIKENSVIHIEMDRAFLNPQISGDTLAVEQNSFWKEATFASNKYNIIEKEIEKTKDSLKIFKLNKELKDEQNKMTNFFIHWVKQHRSSPFSVAIIRLFIAKNNNTEDKVGEECFDYLLPTAKENNYETDLLENIFSRNNRKYRKNLFIKELDSNNFIYLNDKKYSKIPLGTIAPDFSVRDTSGRVIKLSDFKNYLLIDFWASWCGPCRANNPSLKKIYQKYRAKGLKILSVSFDEDSDDWKNAIKKDKMNWIQGSDLLGSKSKIAVEYGADAIPLYELLDQNKRIILKSTGDIDFISKKINDIFNSN